MNDIFSYLQVGQSGFFSRILERFPVEDRTLVFAYGSGVFEQTGQNIRDNVTDLVIVVEDAESWHRKNLVKNPNDYTCEPYSKHS